MIPCTRCSSPPVFMGSSPIPSSNFLSPLFTLFISQKAASNVNLDLNRSLTYYETEKLFTTDWDQLQQDFHCCGIASHTDFERILKLNHSLPESCCFPVTKNETTTDSVRVSNSEHCKHDYTHYTEGCRIPVSYYIRSKCSNLMTVFLFQSILWLVIAMMSCSIGCSIRLKMQLRDKGRRLYAMSLENHLHPMRRF